MSGRRCVRLTAAISHDRAWYVARCLQVEVASQGESIERALANLKEALELSFEDRPLPERSGATRQIAWISLADASGPLSQRGSPALQLATGHP